LFLRIGSGFRCIGFRLLLRVSSRFSAAFCRFCLGIRLRFRISSGFCSSFLRSLPVRPLWLSRGGLGSRFFSLLLLLLRFFRRFLRLQPFLFELFQPFLFRRLFLT
jgi:hypothetical protein